MKILKTILTSALVTSAIAVAHADVTVHITGSTAFRAATVAGIQGILSNVKAGFYTNDGSSSLSGANLCIIQGTNASLGTVTVKCAWTGSGAGIQTIDQELSLPNVWLANSTLPGSGIAAIPSGSVAFDAATKADVAMSDAFQASTPFQSQSLVEPNVGFVGIIPFRWVGCNGLGAIIGSHTNISAQLGRALLSGGCPLSMLTGNPTDATNGLYVIGRNADSGTRITAFSETGYGITTPCFQYQPTPVGTDPTATVTGFQKYPAETVLGNFYPLGRSGYDSGGKVATQMRRPITAGGAVPNFAPNFGPGYFISYPGRSDANTVANNGGISLTYNGYTDADANIQQGLYTYWGYEHMFFRQSDQLTTIGDAANLIASYIYTNSATASGLKVTDMSVGRANDGDTVVHN
jgi:hypothetical protein